MNNNPGLGPALTALANARALAEAAAWLEHELLQELLFDTWEEGLSIREAAELLHTPKSTVARRRRALDRQRFDGSGKPSGAWITPQAYVAANNLVWEHDQSRHISAAGFEVIEREDGRGRTLITRPGQAVRRSAQ